MSLFFTLDSYLHGDPQQAESGREAKQLLRDARKRARLCSCMVQVAARRGYAAASVDETVRLSGFGKGVFYRLFDSKEACSLEAFERCAETIFARVAETTTQRQLLLAAMTDLAGTKGYEATRVADVMERSRLSRWTFYKHFGNKEECFLGAFDTAIKLLVERAKAAMASGGTSADRAEAGLRALVESLSERPALARLVTIEIRTAGTIGEARYSEALARFAGLIAAAGGDHETGTASDIPRLVAGTVTGMIAREVGEGRAAQLEALLPELVFTVLAPYVGGERAAEEMRRIVERKGAISA